MRKLIGLSLALLVLCGFGFGPFFGENRTPAAAGGTDPAIDGTPTSYVNTTSGESSVTTNTDATGADLLLVVVCGLRSITSKTITGSTAATFNSVSMTQLAYSSSSSSSAAFVDCGLWVLDSPDQGSYAVAVTYDNNADSGWIYAANLINTAATQDGDTDSDYNAPVTTLSSTVTPSAAGNLLVHVGAARGEHSYPCTTTNTTKILDGVTGGGNNFIDFAFCVGTATAADTSSVTGTMDWSASERLQSIMVVIK